MTLNRKIYFCIDCRLTSIIRSVCVMFLESITMTQDSNLAVISPFVLVPETVKMTGCPRSTILKYTKLGLFPPMVRLLGDRIAFVRADVEAWIESRLDVSNQQTN